MPRLDPRLVPVFTSLDLRDGDGQPISAVGCGETLEFHLAYAAPREITNPSFGLIISNGMGVPLFFLQTRTQLGLWDQAPAAGTIVCRLNDVPLVPGEYLLTVGCLSGERQLDLLELEHAAMPVTAAISTAVERHATRRWSMDASYLFGRRTVTPRFGAGSGCCITRTIRPFRRPSPRPARPARRGGGR